MLHATVRLISPSADDRRFTASNGRGHELVVDDAIGNAGPKPIELVAMALGGCTAFDVISILRKKRLHVDEYFVEVTAEQAEKPPQVFTHVTITHQLRGSDLTREAVEAAIALSDQKYCSVGAMIRQTATISTAYSLNGEAFRL